MSYHNGIQILKRKLINPPKMTCKPIMPYKVGHATQLLCFCAELQLVTQCCVNAQYGSLWANTFNIWCYYSACIHTTIIIIFWFQWFCKYKMKSRRTIIIIMFSKERRQKKVLWQKWISRGPIQCIHAHFKCTEDCK